MNKKNRMQTAAIALMMMFSLGLLGGCGSTSKAKTDESAMMMQKNEDAAMRAEKAAESAKQSADMAKQAADRAEQAADKSAKMAEKSELIFNKKMKK